MRSPRKVYIERIHSLCVSDDADRFVDFACQVRLYKRDENGDPTPDYWLPTVYGGRFDVLTGRYTGERVPLEHVAEVSIHKGQLPLFNELRSTKRYVLGLGAPGGGKSLGIAKIAQCLIALRPMSNGGIVAPTRDRLEVIWDKFLEILEPIGWISQVLPGKRIIKLRNGTKLKFVAAKKSSSKTGSPIAGKDWHWAIVDEQQNVDDEAMREVDARGRITKDFRIFSSATNEPIHEFQMRVRRYEASEAHVVIRFSGYDNCFTPLEHWEAAKANWNPDDFDRYIRCLDVPQEGRVYPEFSYTDSCSALPARTDITTSVTAKRYDGSYKYIIGFDPGVICTASVILKAFSGERQDERLWMVMGEVTTRDKGTEWHAQELVKWLREHGSGPHEVLVLQDPHENKEADRSDLLVMRQAGFTVFLSNGGPIERRHRISMVNALLMDVNRRRRLKLLNSSAGVPLANKLAESLGNLMYKNGEIDMAHKTKYNLAHWSDALGYALFPFEQFRGGYTGGPAKQGNRWALSA